jgi:hypothetical protein
MAEPILYEILQSLNKTELIRVGKMVKSPFFTHRSDLAQLFTVLIKRQYKQLDYPPKIALFALVYPDRPYDDLLLRATMSDLGELIQEFLIYQHLRASEPRSRLALIAELRTRNLEKLYEKASQKATRLLHQSPHKNADFHQLVADYQLESAQFLTRTSRTTELPLQSISEALDIAWLTQKLRHSCTQLSHQAVYRTQYNYGLLNPVLTEIENGDYLHIPAIALYYYCFRFMTEQYSLDYFVRFRQTLTKNESLFSDAELKTLYLIAINYCIRKLNEGNQPFIQEGWDLYQVGLTRGYFIEHERLSSFTFNNIVAFGIKLRHFAEVDQFITTYQQYLEPSQHDSFVALNMARLNFQRGQVEQALQLLQHADFKDLVNNLIAKTLQLKIYYQLGELSLLESHLESFRIFIGRRKLSDYHQTNYSNILGLVRKMTALSPSDAKGRLALIQQIEKTEILTEREWLLEQLRKD